MLLRFCIVGAFGFLIDSLLLLFLTNVAFFDPLWARGLSFVVAAVFTWGLNRCFTFKSSSSLSSLLPYFIFTGMGAGLNLVVYGGWVITFGQSSMNLIAGVAVGSMISASFNYFVSKYVVFRETRVLD